MDTSLVPSVMERVNTAESLSRSSVSVDVKYMIKATLDGVMPMLTDFPLPDVEIKYNRIQLYWRDKNRHSRMVMIDFPLGGSDEVFLHRYGFGTMHDRKSNPYIEDLAIWLIWFRNGKLKKNIRTIIKQRKLDAEALHLRGS